MLISKTYQDDALRASIEMQQAMPDFNQDLGRGGVAIRIGLHGGSSIAVTLNERPDYYGEAVNLSARLEGQGSAGDITMSKNFASDPAVSDMLSSHDIREQEMVVKGFTDATAITQITPLADDDKSF